MKSRLDPRCSRSILAIFSHVLSWSFFIAFVGWQYGKRVESTVESHVTSLAFQMRKCCPFGFESHPALLYSYPPNWRKANWSPCLAWCLASDLFDNTVRIGPESFLSDPRCNESFPSLLVSISSRMASTSRPPDRGDRGDLANRGSRSQ